MTVFLTSQGSCDVVRHVHHRPPLIVEDDHSVPTLTKLLQL